MTFTPVRIKRDTKQVGKSKIHWLEKLEYKILFAFEGNEDGVKNEIKNYVENKISEYEELTFEIRNRYFEKDLSIKNECISNLSKNLNCKDFNGNGCTLCDFRTTMVSWECFLLDLRKGYDSRDRYVRKLEDAEILFDDIGELILEKEFKVNG